MDSTTSSLRERERFREIYDAAYVDLLRFVGRRGHPTQAEDVLGDVMLVAWRRLDDVPAELSAARAWLFGRGPQDPAVHHRLTATPTLRAELSDRPRASAW
jgi:hypothetical protein